MDESLECRKCRMRFDSKEKLSVHLRKFCADSEYADPEKLKAKLTGSSASGGGAKSSYVSIQEVTAMIRGQGVPAGSSLGQMTVSDLQRRFTEGEDDYRTLQNEVIRKRELEKVEELRQLKMRSKEMMIKRDSEHAEIARLTADMEAQRMRELQLRLERERVRKQLAEVDREQLKSLEEDKKRELEDLVREREAIKAKEMKAIQELEELEAKIQKETQEFRAKQQEQSHALDQPAEKESAYQLKYEGRAKELGETSAKLRVQRDRLQAQRDNVSRAIDQLRTHANEFDSAVAGGAIQEVVGPPVSAQLRNHNVRPPSAAGVLTGSRPGSASGHAPIQSRSVFAAAAQQSLADGTRTRADIVAELASQQASDMERLRKLKEAVRRGPEADLMSVEHIQNEFDALVNSDAQLQEVDISRSLHRPKQPSISVAPASIPLQRPVTIVRAATLASGVGRPGAMPVDLDEEDEEAAMLAAAARRDAEVLNIGANRRRDLAEAESLMMTDTAKSSPRNNEVPEAPTKVGSGAPSPVVKSSYPTSVPPAVQMPPNAGTAAASPMHPHHSAYAQMPYQMPASQSPDPAIDALNAEIAQLRAEYTRGGGTRPDILQTIQSLEADVAAIRAQKATAFGAPPAHYQPHPHLPPPYGYPGMHFPPHGMPPMPPMPPMHPYMNPYGYPHMAPPPHPMSAHSNSDAMLKSNPLLQQMQQQMSTMQKLLAQQEAENARAQAEAEQAARARELERQNEQRMNMERLLMRSMQQLSGGGGGGGDDKRQPASSFGINSGQLELLQQLPKDSELYQLQMDQLKMMAEKRFEQEMFEQQIRMQRMKIEAERLIQAEADAKEEAHAASVLRREMEQRRAQQLMPSAPPAAQNVVTAAAAAPATVYNPVSGFTIMFDALKGLNVAHDLVCLVFSLFDGAQQKTKARDSPSFVTVIDPTAADPAAATRQALIAFRKQFAKVPIIPSLKMLIEVQWLRSGDDKPSVLGGIGWTVINLFRPNNTLADGAFKLSLHRLPKNTSISPAQLAADQASALPGQYLFLRIAHSGPDADRATDADFEHLHTYQSLLENAAAPPIPAASTAAPNVPAAPVPAIPTSHISTSSVPQAPPSTDRRASVVGVINESTPAADAEVAAVSEPQPSQRDSLADAVFARQASVIQMDDQAPADLSVADEPAPPAAEEVPAPPAAQSEPTIPVGVLVERMEHSSVNPFSRVRCTLYVGQQPMTSSTNAAESFVFDSPYAQVGASGRLGITEWQYRFLSERAALHSSARCVFEVFELKDKPKGTSEEIRRFEVAAGWAAVDLFTPDDKTGAPQLFRSTQKLSLYQLPIDLADWPAGGERRVPTDSTLVVQLYPKSDQPEARRVDLFAREDAAALAKQPFIPLNSGKPSDRAFEPGDGWDIYVDGARFLPDNATISRVLMQVYTAAGEVVATAAAVCAPTGTVFSPTYGLRTEMRREAFDPTCTLVFRIDTVDLNEKQVRLVGVAAINAFVDRTGLAAPTDAALQDFCLNEGSFQIPVLATLPATPAQMSSFAAYKDLPRLPCCTLLLRIRRAPRSADRLRVLSTAGPDAPPEREWARLGLVEPAPTYSSRVYDSTRAQPSSAENKLYNKRAVRPDMSVTDIILRIMRPEKNESIEQIRGPDELIKYINSRLVPPRGELKPHEMRTIDLNRFAQYSADIGFKIAIDFATELDPKQLAICLVSLLPPGAYYNEHRLIDDVHYTNSWDPTSLIKFPRWGSGFNLFRDIELNSCAAAIFDIRVITSDSLNSDKPQLTPLCFGVMPLFADGFFNSGHYQVPLFEGAVPPALLSEFQKDLTENVLAAELAKRKPMIKYRENSALYVRLVDEQRPELICQPMDMRALNLKFVPLDLRPSLKYDAAEAASGSFWSGKPKPISTLILDWAKTERNAKDSAAALQKWRRELVRKLQGATGIAYNV